MKKISRFDIIMIVAFLVVALLGGGAAYYLAAFQLAAAQDDVRNVGTEFNQYSSQMVFLPTQENLQILQGNIDLLHAQIDPLVKNNLQAPGDKLTDQVEENTVDWKHRLDATVAKLNAAAKVAGVQVPDNYYYAFSGYLNQAPAEAKTGVLSKQLVAIEELTNILIGAEVNSIKRIGRTAEESGGPGIQGGDFIAGHAVKVAGGIYTAYPFELEFDATTDSLRKVIDSLMQSPYVFVIRNIAVENSQTASPQLSDLDRIAGTPATTSVIDSPGAVAASKSPAGPQYLFGSEILHVKLRVDLIEWRGLAPNSGHAADKPGAHPATPPAN